MIDQSLPERETVHRHNLEKNQIQMIQRDAALMRWERRRGQWIGSISAFTEHESVASVIFGTTISWCGHSLCDRPFAKSIKREDT